MQTFVEKLLAYCQLSKMRQPVQISIEFVMSVKTNYSLPWFWVRLYFISRGNMEELLIQTCTSLFISKLPCKLFN